VIRVILADEARADALDAFAFYEGRRPGLGERFREHVNNAISKIQRSPERYPLVYRDLRRRLVERFPYAVFYRIYPGTVVVVALMHGRQDPSIGKGRARRSQPG
jgi:toxin ParE1/3/4